VVEKQAQPALTPLMSLSAAAAVVYKAATKRDLPSEEALNITARMIAARTRVLTAEEGHEPAMLMPSEIFEGKFQEGGDCLVFPDGRQPLPNLRILTSALAGLIADISALYK